MNKDRRKAIDTIMADIEKARVDYEAACAALLEASRAFDDICSSLDEVKDEEQEYYDAMPSNIQEGDKGQTAQEAISQMEQALDSLREIADNEADPVDLDSVITALDEAKQ